MGLFRTSEAREPIRVDTARIPVEPKVTADGARIALAVACIDETLKGDRSDARRLVNALLEVRHALAPVTVPVVSGRPS